MKFVWVPDSTSDVLLKFSLVGRIIECRGAWRKSSSVGVWWYYSTWDVFFFITNFCATIWVAESLMVFLSMFVASAWTITLLIASISARFFFPFILTMAMSIFGLNTLTLFWMGWGKNYSPQIFFLILKNLGRLKSCQHFSVNQI